MLFQNEIKKLTKL